MTDFRNIQIIDSFGGDNCEPQYFKMRILSQHDRDTVSDVIEFMLKADMSSNKWLHLGEILVNFVIGLRFQI